MEQADWTVRDFQFASGESLPALRLHYRTLGRPERDAAGNVVNAMLLLHGTSGSGANFLQEEFASEMFGPGQPLDTTRYYVILPDNVGHGASSKPSDGLRAAFPHYGYEDMLRLQYRLVVEHLGLRHLRLVLGTSMGGMHTWMWGARYPDMMDALLPCASLPVQIAGRNRMARRMMLDAIRNDPDWKDGNYVKQPRGLRHALEILFLTGSSALSLQRQAPTRDGADALLEKLISARLSTTDANDFWYAMDSSRDYNPLPELGRIRAPLLALNSADDLVNPVELGILEREIARLADARAVVLPITEATRGHTTYMVAKLWRDELAGLLKRTQPPAR